jgi:hypothetical protein
MQEGSQKKYRCPKAVGQEKTYAVTPLNKAGDANEQLGNRQCENDRDHPNNEFKNVHRYLSPLPGRYLRFVIRVLAIR